MTETLDRPLAKQTQYSLFGPQGTPYPGHPLILAYLIMETFPTLEEALLIPRGKQVRQVFDGSGVPGSIGNIEVAVAVLRLAREGKLEDGYSLASQAWRMSSGGYFESADGSRGQAQAESLKPAFESKHAKWGRIG